MRSARPVAVLAGLLALGACAASDPLERIISAPTTGRLAAWRSHAASDYNVDTLRRIEQALQEIRLSFAGERELKRQLGEEVVNGVDSLDESVRQRVHGRRLREVLQLGCELRVRRLKEELAGLENAMDKNSRLVTRPGDLESKHHLEGLQERQSVRVEQYRADLAAAERELAPLFAKSGRPMLEPRVETPDEPPLRIKKESAKAGR